MITFLVVLSVGSRQICESTLDMDFNFSAPFVISLIVYVQKSVFERRTARSVTGFTLDDMLLPVRVSGVLGNTTITANQTVFSELE